MSERGWKWFWGSVAGLIIVAELMLWRSGPDKTSPQMIGMSLQSAIDRRRG